MIENILLLISSVVGATFIVTRSYIFESFRNKFINNEFFYTLFSCPQCLSFWCGILFSLFMWPLMNVSTYVFILYTLGVAFTSSGICYLLSRNEE